MATETTVDMTADQVSKPGHNELNKVVHPTRNSENGYRNNSEHDSNSDTAVAVTTDVTEK